MTDLIEKANKLYGNSEDSKPSGNTEGRQPSNNTDQPKEKKDPFASFFKMLEKNPDHPYIKDFDKRHPELKQLTPEARPFMREVLMRQEIKGWHPKIFETKRSEEDERKHMANGTSGLSNPRHSKHFDLGRGADAADAADKRYAWGPKAPDKGKVWSPDEQIQDRRAKAYFEDQKRSFEETRARWGDRGQHFRWGGNWKHPYDPAHIENALRISPKKHK